MEHVLGHLPGALFNGEFCLPVCLPSLSLSLTLLCEYKSVYQCNVFSFGIHFMNRAMNVCNRDSQQRSESERERERETGRADITIALLIFSPGSTKTSYKERNKQTARVKQRCDLGPGILCFLFHTLPS